MPDKQKSASTWKVMVTGAEFTGGTLALAMVEDSLHMPDMCMLMYQDQSHNIVSTGKFEIGKELEIKAFDEANTGGKALFKGEVTALEASFENGKSYTTIRAFDKAHRLYRGRKTKVFKDVKYSDVVKTVAQGAGLSVADVKETSGVRPHVAQLNMSDAEFLKMLAGECGYILLVQDGKVTFKPATAAADAPDPPDMGAEAPLALVPGVDVTRFTSVVTADSQVASVEVRSWNTKDKKMIKSTASAATTAAAVGVKPADIAAKFGSPVFTAVDVPYGTQAEVDAVAKALADQIASVHAQLEGVARGNLELRAGKAVSLGTAGAPFDGKYTLTSTRHIYDNGEYTTQFYSTGAKEKTLQSLTSGGGGGGGGSSPAFVTSPIAGVVTGIVTNVTESSDSGNDIGAYRVKVKIDQFGDNFETDWMQVVQPGNGPDRGSLIMPEVNDQVVVAFDRGDIRRGYVLGGVYNGKDKPNAAATKGMVASDGKIDRRAIVSRSGSYLMMSDKSGKESVTLSTVGDKYMVTLDQAGTTVKVASDGKVEISGKQDIAIKGQAKLTLESTSDMSIKGSKVSIEATGGDVTIKGINVKAQGSAGAEVKGAMVKISADATMDVTAGAVTTIKGAIVKIN